MSEHTHGIGGGWAVTQWEVPGCPACVKPPRHCPTCTCEGQGDDR